MLSCHIVPFLTHCHFDFLLRRGSTTMWAGKMELWPWPWTMEEGETMFVSGRIYINLGTCEIWGHLFALLKNLKHEQHKSPTGCWQCFTKQLLTWSLESDLMKLLCCNFAYMRRQWSFAESSCPSGSRKGNCKKKPFANCNARTFGFGRLDFDVTTLKFWIHHSEFQTEQGPKIDLSWLKIKSP